MRIVVQASYSHKSTLHGDISQDSRLSPRSEQLGESAFYYGDFLDVLHNECLKLFCSLFGNESNKTCNTKVISHFHFTRVYLNND